MNKLIYFPILLCTLWGQLFAQSEGTLRVTVVDIQAIKGDIHVAVFPAGKDFPNGADYLLAKHRAVQGPEATLLFSLPPGTYAVSVYQDLDGDEKHDKNFLGIPTEPFCFSQNRRPGISAPDFEDCAFTLTSEGKALSLRLLP